MWLAFKEYESINKKFFLEIEGNELWPEVEALIKDSFGIEIKSLSYKEKNALKTSIDETQKMESIFHDLSLIELNTPKKT